MKKFYLVARGKINNEFVTTPYKCSSLISSKGFINTDYMGSAEFEFGSIPRFYRRVMRRMDQSTNAYTMINLKDEIGVENCNGVPFWAYVHSPEKMNFLEAMSDYIDDLKDRNKIRSWRLKKWTNIDNHLFRSKDSLDKPDSNIWYSIDGINKDYIGDWFMMIGAKDRPDAFEQIICADYRNWWVNLPLDERVKDYRERRI